MLLRFHILLGLMLGSVSAAAQRSGFITTPDKARLAYTVIGRGPAVIVPGGFLVREAFASLADHHTLILYDMRNRGRSSSVTDSTTLTVQQDVRDLETVRVHFKIDRPALIGVSYLGLVVALYAMDHPDHLDRAVQVDPVPLRFGTRYPDNLTAQDEPVDSAAWAELQGERRAGLSASNPRLYCEHEWRVLRFRLVGDPGKVDRLGPGNCDLPNEWPINLERHFRFNFGSVQRLDIAPDRLNLIRVPVLTIHGTRDRNAPYGGGREWALRLPQARLLTIEGAAHLPWVDAPDIVIPAIGRFLDGQWPEQSEKVTSLEGGRPDAPDNPDDSATTRDVLGMIDSVLAAGIRADTQALSRLYAPQYLHTNANGSRMSLPEVMASYRASPPDTAMRAMHDEDRVIIDSDGAVVSCRVNLYRGNGSTVIRQFRVSYFLERHDGRWRILASHASILQ